jgi:beta-glucuronidase
MVNDLNQIRDMGGNFVRTSHYPNDMRFLDLCDEIGVLVWEESHARHLVYEDERFPDQLLENTREMVHWHINHPSILMWGCLSEWESDTRRGRPIYEKVIQLIRELDPSRPVTFASNRADRDLCLDLVDVVAWSRYVGWHQGRIEDIESDIAGLVRWLDGSSSGARGKPLLLSAFGAAALYGNRQTSGVKWTEEYQHALLDESLRVYAGHSRIAGALVWQFCDCRLTPGEASHRFLDRPRCMDNGGVVDEYRRPKMACEAVRRRMRGALGLT